MMMMTFMKVKSHQRSNVGKRCTPVTKLGQKESLMQVDDGDDLHEGQRSSEVKCGKFCTMVTKLGQKNR